MSYLSLRDTYLTLSGLACGVLMKIPDKELEAAAFLKKIVAKSKRVNGCFEYPTRQKYARIRYKNEYWRGNRLALFLSTGVISNKIALSFV